MEYYSSRHAARDRFPSNQAPKAIGPYSQAIAVDLVPAAGGRPDLLLGPDPARPGDRGEMVGAGDVRAQTERVLQNLDAVLRAGGASLAMVVKTTIYLADLQDFAAVNDVYARYFPDPPASARDNPGRRIAPRRHGRDRRDRRPRLTSDRPSPERASERVFQREARLAAPAHSPDDGRVSATPSLAGFGDETRAEAARADPDVRVAVPPTLA